MKRVKVIHKKSGREGLLVGSQAKYFTVLVQYPEGMVYHRQEDIRICENYREVNDKDR